MGRWTQYDEDVYRLPEGMVRTGYDADTGQYYYKTTHGASYVGQPGAQYGVLRPTGSQQPPEPVMDDPEVQQKSSSKRRASAASAFRSLRRSLSTVRYPSRWRRDHDDEAANNDVDDEPVLVSRPPSVASVPQKSSGTAARPKASPTPQASSVVSPPPVPTKSASASESSPASTSKKSKSNNANSGTFSFSFSSSLSPASGVKLRPTSFTLPRSSSSNTRSRRAASEQQHSTMSRTRQLTIASPTPRHATPIFDAMHTIELAAEGSNAGQGSTTATTDHPAAASGSGASASNSTKKSKLLRSSRRHSSDVRAGTEGRDTGAASPSTDANGSRDRERRRASASVVPLQSKSKSEGGSKPKAEAESMSKIPPIPPKQI
ncbi:hypothetical protein C8F01DRAFT_1179084 [Mycena amicta]|nr:hypothetical protein C8F01DRAFT_1179084 [Mycena amicta]